MVIWDWLKVRPHGRHLRRALVLLVLVPLLALAGEALIRARLDPLSSEDTAIRVYARPLALARGDYPDPGAVQDQLRRLGYRDTRGRDVGIGEYYLGSRGWVLSLIHISEPTRPFTLSRMPTSA